MASFLVLTGLTGALIAWEHELDAALNPDLYFAQGNRRPGTNAGVLGRRGTPKAQTLLGLAETVEARDPEALVTFVPLSVEPGHTLRLFVSGRADASGTPRQLDYNQVALDPGTGWEQARRQWGAARFDALHALPFLYKLHYSLHMPPTGGVQSGALLLGIVAIVWVVDAFVALWIAFPNRRTWRKSFAFRLRKGSAKLTFDLHRSGGVWAWAVLLVFAVTAVSMNLGPQVVRPLVDILSPLSPDPLQEPPARDATWEQRPRLPRGQVLVLAQQRARQLGITAPAGGMFLSPLAGAYGVGFYAAGQDHADGKLGNPWLYFDARTGASLGDKVPGAGSAGDLFMQLQFPLHSGRLFGLWGRAFVSLLGVLVSVLSVTGVVIWARKRRARALARMTKGLGGKGRGSGPEAYPGQLPTSGL